MKEKRIPVFIAIMLMILAIAGAAGWLVAKRFIPTKEPADLGQVLGVRGEETAVFLNGELQEVKGITREGQSYLPLEWVNAYINEKFYWDHTEQLLVYALPDSIVYADRQTVGSLGSPLMLFEGDEIYLSVGLINNYTAVERPVIRSSIRLFEREPINKDPVISGMADKIQKVMPIIFRTRC